MISFSAVLYLMVRALPRIQEEAAMKEGFLDRWAHSEVPEKVDAAVNGYLLKFLRKVKVVVLKLDNTLSKHLQTIQHHEKQKNTAIDLTGMTETSTPSKEEVSAQV